MTEQPHTSAPAGHTSAPAGTPAAAPTLPPEHDNRRETDAR
ncbi:hypothetical protein [Streptomyces pulveraceus]|uniref:Uncharacterized protein n=1 Tax=Streptomyces pulveraceus TaxID=68258 RepID=A0ABW1GS48_9ACTN